MNPYRRRTVLGLGLVAGVLLAVAYLVHFRARWAVERYERQLVAAGETLTVGPLVPPAVLPENNGAPLFNRAMGGLIWRKTLLETNLPPCMRMVAPGRAMVAPSTGLRVLARNSGGGDCSFANSRDWGSGEHRS